MTVKKRILTLRDPRYVTAEGHGNITGTRRYLRPRAQAGGGLNRLPPYHGLPTQSEKNPVASTVDNASTWTPLSENILMAWNHRNYHGNLVGTTYGLPNAVIIETKSAWSPPWQTSFGCGHHPTKSLRTGMAG